jgi:hypothetical protein
MRYCALLLLLCWSLIATASQCPDGYAHKLTIGGKVLYGSVLRHADKPPVEPVKPAKVTVYSSAGKKVYVGVTNDSGEFGSTGVLSAGDYHIVVDGFGDYYVTLDPKEGDTGGPDSLFFTLWLADHGCASFMANGN